MKIVFMMSWLTAVHLAAVVASGEVVEISPVRDNTLYQDAEGGLSNGAGERFFAGRTGQPAGISIRRGLIAFDVAGSIPSGATVTDVTLRLRMSQTVSGAQTVSLHAVLGGWGEGDSDAAGEAAGGEGAGAPAESGDATWLHRFYDTEFWNEPGGDFDSASIASASVAGTGFYTWSSPEMAANVQGWLDEPEANFGWLVRGNESAGFTAKRFEGRHSSTPEWRPVLIVEYTLSEPEPMDPPGFTDLRWLGSALELTFVTTPGRVHVLEWTEELEANSVWQTHTGGIEGDGETVTIIDETAGEASRRFYRVRLEP